MLEVEKVLYQTRSDAPSLPVAHFPRTLVLGVGVSAVNVDTATSEIMRWIAEREQHYVTVTGVHGVIESQGDAHFKRLLNASGLTVPDGMPLVWLSKWAGHGQAVSRVCGYDLVLSASRTLGEKNLSAFYYGGAPGVAAQLASVLESRCPGLRTAGVYCPPFRDLSQTEEEEVIAIINSSGARVVWVGLSTPKQERWMARSMSRLDMPVLVGVGAAFDFLTGRVKRAPQWIQILGMEWLYRLLQEPQRLWKRYLRNNPLFIYYVVCEKLGLRRFDTT